MLLHVLRQLSEKSSYCQHYYRDGVHRHLCCVYTMFPAATAAPFARNVVHLEIFPFFVEPIEVEGD